MMRFIVLMLAALLLPAAAGPNASNAADSRPSPGPVVLVATIDGSINPVTADYLSGAIAEARARGAGALVVELDTPGGLESAMRRMVRDILNTPTPVVVYVAPSGARAASAGLLVTLASDLAAMAPGTNIGAAHPVGIGGGTLDNTMAGKVENDSAAYARSLAEKKGRNPAWAETAVRKSASISEREALDNGVIDLVSPDLPTLLAQIDGRTVKKDSGNTTLRTKGAPVARYPMRLRHRVLSALADPNVAYILLMIGIYGIFFELANPGALFPGIVGGIALILGFFALQTLSADYAGVLLILLGVVLFLLEVKIVSHGALAIGGTVAMFLGGLMLFRSSGDPWLRVSWSVLGTMAALSALFFSSLVWLVVKSRGARPTTGIEGLVGATGEARTGFAPGGKGKVYVLGEIWDARSLEPIGRGDDVVVESLEGMTLHVRPRTRPAPPEPQSGS